MHTNDTNIELERSAVWCVWNCDWLTELTKPKNDMNIIIKYK